MEKVAPIAPITAAARPLPIDAKRALRPSRSPSAACPTSSRLTAAIAGVSTQLAVACNTKAAIVESCIGANASSSAEPVIPRMPMAAAVRLFVIASTRAPPGIWLSIIAVVPTLSASPICTSVHFCAVR